MCVRVHMKLMHRPNHCAHCYRPFVCVSIKYIMPEPIKCLSVLMGSHCFFSCLCAVRQNVQSEMNLVKWVGSTWVFYYYFYFVSIRKCVCQCTIYGKKCKEQIPNKSIWWNKAIFTDNCWRQAIVRCARSMRTNNAEGHNISEMSLLMMMINAMIDKDSFLLIVDWIEDCGKIITATGTSSRTFGCVLRSCTTASEAGALAGSCRIFVSNWTRMMNTWTLLAHKFLSLVVTNSEISMKKNWACAADTLSIYPSTMMKLQPIRFCFAFFSATLSEQYFI